ncbi:adenylosuccinate synthetase [Striga asiatica]|uniref:Adenylosuccinate synthetase n=1 Tax=Striga asiatica TaxID=4170 RepID=A0A5A7R5S5_STRAF|nr:adenylosuccinate synthetase [Striga asiatica]
MLLRVTNVDVVVQARPPELWPQASIPHDDPRVIPGQGPELRPDPKVLELHLGKHRFLSTRRPPLVRAGLLDPAREPERVQGNAGRREEDEHGVGPVVEERVGEQPASSRGEGGGAAARGLGGDDTAGEHAGERRRVIAAGVGVDVDVVRALGGACEVQLPEGREW